MTASPDEPELAEPLPSARVAPRRWRLPIVWVVPLVAAIVAGYLIVSRFQEFGPTITIRFRDGSGVKAGQTELRYRGVPVGEVTEIGLSRNREHVLVTRGCAARPPRWPGRARCSGSCGPRSASGPCAV
jgi:paraquat-inducible protein B